MKFWKITKKFLTYKIAVWTVLLLIVLIFIGWFKGYFAGTSSNNQKTSISSSVQYIEEAEEVVFLNTGIAKVISKSDSTNIPFTDIDIPLSKKTALIILRYKAKFGIKQPVDIEELGDNSYKVHVPRFEVIGIEQEEENPYEIYDKNGELLSFSTKDIDTGELVSQGLSIKEQETYMKKYEGSIQESATEYYENIIQSISPGAEVIVTFK